MAANIKPVRRKRSRASGTQLPTDKVMGASAPITSPATGSDGTSDFRYERAELGLRPYSRPRPFGASPALILKAAEVQHSPTSLQLDYALYDFFSPDFGDQCVCESEDAVCLDETRLRPIFRGHPSAVTNLQSQVKTQCFVERSQKVRRQRSDLCTDALNGDGTDLLGLSLGVEPKSSLACGQHDLERIHPFCPRSHRHYGQDSPSEPLGGAVSSVVTDDHCRAPLIVLRAPSEVEVDQSNLATAHQARPSLMVASQSLPSSSSAHSCQASS